MAGDRVKTAIITYPDNRESKKLPCKVRSCLNRGTERKPYCLEHIDRHSYAANLIDELASMEAEEAMAIKSVRSWQRIDVYGPRSRELLEILRWKGVVNLQRLAVDVGLATDVTEAYVKALCKARKARMKTIKDHSRGSFRTIVEAL